MPNNADGGIIIDTKIDPQGFEKDSAKLKNAISSVCKKADDIGTTFHKAISGNKSAISSFEEKTKALENTISNLENEMSQMGKTRYVTDDFSKVTTDIEEEEAHLRKLSAQLKEISDSGKGWEYTDEYKSLQKYIDQCNLKLSRLQEQEEKMKATGVSSRSNRWATLNYEIANTQKQLKAYETEMAELSNNNKITQESQVWINKKAEIDASIQKLKQYNATKNMLQNSRNDFVDGSHTEEYAQLNGQLSAAKEKLAQMKDEAEQTANKISKVEKRTKRWHSFTSGLKSAFRGIGSILKGAMSKGISSFKNNLKNAGKSADGLQKKLLKVGVALLGMRGLMGGIKQLVSSALNDNEQLQGQLTALKGVLGTALTPIINTLVNGLSTAATLADRIYQIFTGTSLIAKYNAAQTAKMASGTASAAKSAKEMNRQLADFDDLNVLSDNSKDDSSDKSSDSSLFEPAKLSSSMSGFVNELKALIQKGDWAGIGKLIGEKVNDDLQRINDYISWDNVGAKITKGVTAFTTAFNSLIDTIDWNLLGDTIAQGINTLVNTLFLLLTQIDFGRMGQSLAENFNGLIHGIDWGLLGQTLSAAVQDVIMFCYKAVTTFDWKGLGSAFATFVNDAFGSVDWKLLGTTLSESIKGALGTLRTAIQEIDWKAIGQDVSDFLNGIDWVGIISDLAGLVSDVLVGAGDLLCGFVEELDWGKLASDLWNSLVGLITNIDWSKLIANAFELLGALLSASAQIWVSFTTTIADGISNALTNVITKIQSDIEACGGNVIEGLKKGISDAFSNIWQWIKDNIFYPFIDGFCSAFGIHSPSREMATLGEYIIEGLKNGITGVWDTVTDFFGTALEDLKVSITNGFNNAKDNAVSAVENLKTKVSDTFNTTKINVSNTVNKLKTDATTAFNSAKTNIANTATNIKNNVVNAFSNAKTNAVNSFNTLKSNTSSSINSLKNDVSSRMDDIKNSITSNLQNALDNAKNRDWESIGINICTGISDGINEKWQWLKDKVGDVASSLLDKAKRVLDIHSPSRSFRDIIGKNIMLGLGGGLENGTSNVLKTVSDIAKSISNEFANQTYKTGTIVPTAEVNGALSAFSDEVTDSFTTMLDKLQAIADTVTFKAPNIATSGVIPYSVSASIAADTSNIGDKIEASNNELASVFIQSITNQTAALVAALQSNKSQNGGTIDYSKITSNVIDDINRRTRMLGASPLTI